MIHGEHVLPHTLYALFTIHFNFWAMKTSLTCPIILFSGSCITTTVVLVRSLILQWVGFSTVLKIYALASTIMQAAKHLHKLSLSPPVSND